MIWFQWLVFFVSVALQILVIASLRRGVYKDYPFVLAYSLILLLTTLADASMVSKLVPLSNTAKRLYFYRDEAVRQFLLFIVVVSLIERAIQTTHFRARIGVFLGLAGSCAVFLSLLAHSDSATFTLWMTGVTRDLSFGSVVLTLLLWLIMLSSQKRDHLLLLITGGLGLQFTGEAIGQSLRQISVQYHAALLPGNLLASISHIIRLYIWLEAFRRAQRSQARKETNPDGERLPRQAETLFQSKG